MKVKETVARKLLTLSIVLITLVGSSKTTNHPESELVMQDFTTEEEDASKHDPEYHRL